MCKVVGAKVANDVTCFELEDSIQGDRCCEERKLWCEVWLWKLGGQWCGLR